MGAPVSASFVRRRRERRRSRGGKDGGNGHWLGPIRRNRTLEGEKVEFTRPEPARCETQRANRLMGRGFRGHKRDTGFVTLQICGATPERGAAKDFTAG